MLCEASVKLFGVFGSAWQCSILSSLLYSVAMNTVRSRQNRPFSQLTLEEKLEVKRLGPDRPQLLTKLGLFSRRFSEFHQTLVLKAQLAAGCSHSGKVYCFFACFLKILNEKKLGPSLV